MHRHHPSLYNPALVSPYVKDERPFPRPHFVATRDMIDHSASSHLQALFDCALRDYEKQTGTSLVKHPLVERLEYCHNVDSVMAVLEDQSKALRESRGSDGRIMKSLKSAVSILFTLSTSDALDVASSLVC